MTDDRIERFKTDVSGLDAATAAGPRDQLWITVGVVLMVLGIVIGFGGYFSATNASDARDQNELIILALGGLSVTVLGAALFVRYTLGRFLRFFLLRQIYEGRAHLDRVVEAIERRG